MAGPSATDSSNGTRARKEGLPDPTTREDLLAKEDDRKSPVVAELRRRVRHFGPNWYSVSMGTGITGLLIHELPYQFSGIRNIGNVLFVFTILLFVIFSCISITRYMMYPLWKTTMFDADQAVYWATLSMTLSTIINMIVYSCVPAFGHNFVILAWVLWWINSVIAISIGIGLPFVMFNHQKHDSLNSMTGSWFLPNIATTVASGCGAIVASVLPPAHARLTIIVSYILWGTGFPICLILMSLFFNRLAIHKAPPGVQVTSCFLPVGPAGMGAYAILKLSADLKSIAESPSGIGFGNLLIEEGKIFAMAIYAGSIPIALVVWGLGLFWLSNAILTISHLASKRTIPFGMGWWSFTFPLGVFATATTQFGTELGSGAFKVIGTILSLAVVALWLVCMAFTLKQGWRGELFDCPTLDEAPREGEMDDEAESTRRGEA